MLPEKIKVTFHNFKCDIHNRQEVAIYRTQTSTHGNSSLSNSLPSKWSEHERTAMLPFRSETTAVSASIRIQSATNLCDGSQ